MLSSAQKTDNQSFINTSPKKEGRISLTLSRTMGECRGLNLSLIDKYVPIAQLNRAAVFETVYCVGLSPTGDTKALW